LRYYNHYIQNKFPILGIQGINFQSKDTDMYYKGAAMLHTLRKSINNDQLWWKVLKSFYQKNILKTISTSDFIDFVSEMINKDLTPFFSQYLTTSQIPILEIQINGKEINYMWKNCVANFEMPIYIESNGKKICLQVNSKPQKINLNYVNIEQLVFPLGLYQYRINNNQIKNAY
jgi:aminopeptidase N